MSIASYDFTASVPATPANDNRDNFTVTASGIKVAWVASPPGDPRPFGQIMLHCYQIVADDAGEPSTLVAAGIDGQVETTAIRADGDKTVLANASDNVVEPGRGRDPVVTGPAHQRNLVGWIDAAGKVQAHFFLPMECGLPPMRR